MFKVKFKIPPQTAWFSSVSGVTRRETASVHSALNLRFIALVRAPVPLCNCTRASQEDVEV